MGVEQPRPVERNPFPVDAWTDPGYEQWFQAHRATDAELARQRAESEGMAERPVFSFIVPLYKTPLDYLEVMARSVLDQTYPALQLVLVNASPELPELSEAAAALAARDERVTVVALEGNLGITENTNAGIAVATGDFCCFLDHDDFIEPNLLFEYVQALHEHPDIDVLYCDEDMVEDGGAGDFRHVHPLFKPDYSPEFLLSKNYLMHLMTIRRSIIGQMPLPDARFDGSQDFNMALWCTAHARRVARVPRVLYHWRIHAQSTATNPDSKPYTLRSCRLALAGQVERLGLSATIIEMGIYLLHALWFQASGAARVSVVVDVRSADDLPLFAELFCQNNSCPQVEVLLVGADEGAASGLGDIFRAVSCPAGATRYERLNLGASQAQGDYLLFMDSGCRFDTAQPLEQLMGLCAVEGVGVAAPKVRYGDGRTKSYGVAVTGAGIFPRYRGYEDDFPGYQCSLRAFQNASAVEFEGMMVARALFEELGGFDAAYASEIGAVEFCHRVRASGARVALTPTVKLHTDAPCPEQCFVAAKNAPDYTVLDLARFDASWPGVRAEGDSYGNPQCDQVSGYCQLPPSAPIHG